MTNMTNAEAVLLCRFAKACCPQQQFDAYTPDAWFELLGDLRFEDCKAALTRVVRKQPFVSPAEIRDETKRVRADRLAEFDRCYRFDPPAELADDPRAENVWYFAVRQKIADGEITHPNQIEGATGCMESAAALARGNRDVETLGQIGRSVPRA